MIRLTTIAMLISLFAPVVSAESITAPGKVVAVTVYQGQALVTRELELPETEGLVEIVVTELPERLQAGSLYAEPGEDVEVRSVRARVRPSDKAPSEEVNELEQQATEVRHRLESIAREKQLLKQRSEYLNQLETFGSSTAKMELQKGVLNADTLREMTELIFEERTNVTDREGDLAIEEEEAKEELNLIRQKLASFASGNRRAEREAVVFLSKEAGAAKVRLNYLVAGATWSPSYNIRAAEEGKQISVEYNASVTQTSGDIAMTLSTATPSLVATAPKLDSLTIRLAAQQQTPSSGRKVKSQLSREQKSLAMNRGNMPASDGDPFGYGRASSDLSAETQSAPQPPAFGGEVGGGGYGGGGFGATYANDSQVADTDDSLNRLACEIQILDLASGSSASQQRDPPESPSTEGMSVVYRLPNKTSLPSRSDKQLIQIAALPLEAELYRIATPVLTNYVYQEAKLTNTTDLVFLSGPAATFLGDRFVGRGTVPTVAIGESFEVGLGIDESLRASRELVDKTDRIQGGNRIATFDYRLGIENFGSEAVEVRVMDRLPKSAGDAIKVSLVESKPEATKRDANDDGLIRWDLDVPTAAIGKESAAVTYKMTIEHDKNLTIVGDVK